MRQLVIVWGVILLGSACSTVAYSQTQPVQAPVGNQADASAVADPATDAIRKAVAASVATFNQRDAKAAAALWTKDGEYVDENGVAVVGREAIEAYFAEVFAARPEAKWQLVTDDVRLLSENTAIEDGHSIVEPSPKAAAEISRYTAVHVKVDGKWLLASVRDSWVDDSSPDSILADLSWLIGDWIAEENGVRTESTCRWIVNNRFVERSYTTTQLDGTATTGLQIIGWNSQTHHVQSWNFTADGGHAIGVWSATEGGWLAKVTGTTGDSVSTTAINVLRRLDDNAYAWQSIDRTVGDVRLPDSDEVIIRRKPSTK